MKQILLVEPHPDDVCLSLFHFLKRIKAGYSLVSVSSDNGRSSKEFCEMMNIEHYLSKSISDIDYHSNRISLHVMRKQSDSFVYQRDYYLEKYRKVWGKMTQIISPAVTETSSEIIMTVLGILHPFHVLTSLACEWVANSLGKTIVYFADFPYASRKFGEKIIRDSGLKSFKICDERLGKHKIATFEKYYPTETNILRWDRNSIGHHPEMIFFPKEMEFVW